MQDWMVEKRVEKETWVHLGLMSSGGRLPYNRMDIPLFGFTYVLRTVKKI